MIKASVIIESARDMHPLFDENSTPGKVALRRLQTHIDMLYQRVVSIDPRRFEKCEEIVLATFDFDAGHVLPEALHYDGRSVEEEGDTVGRFYLIDQRVALDPPVWPSGYIKKGRTLCLAGPEADWDLAKDDFDTIKIAYVPAIADLVNGESTFEPLPDEAAPSLIADLALMMARRLQGRKDAPSLVPFINEASDSRDNFIATIANQKTAKVDFITPVW